MPHIRVHELKHTIGRRLRAAGVSSEDRQDLLRHRSGRITARYSAVELSGPIAAAEKVSQRNGERPEPVIPELVVLARALSIGSRQTPARATTTQRADEANLCKSMVPQEGLEPPTP